jgi:hypothetical protein
LNIILPKMDDAEIGPGKLFAVAATIMMVAMP